MDRWYRRAAIVLWPREQSFAVHAEAAPAWAMGKLLERLRNDGLAEAREMAATLAPFWPTVVGRGEGASFPLEVAKVAEGLDDADLAHALLRPFSLEQWSPGDARTLVGLVGRYGDAWWKELLATWSSPDFHRGLRAPVDEPGVDRLPPRPLPGGGSSPPWRHRPRRGPRS